MMAVLMSLGKILVFIDALNIAVNVGATASASS
jgi:hypothetical protein